jgi:hypothetical protein
MLLFHNKRVEPASHPRSLKSFNFTTSLDDPPPIYPIILENQSTNVLTEMSITKEIPQYLKCQRGHLLPLQ